MREFEHGGDVGVFAKAQNCKKKEVIDLSSNINFVKAKFKLKNIDISSYPDYKALTQRVKSHFGVDDGEIEIFNGGSSAIFSLLRNLKESRCYIYSPAYLEYKKAAQIVGKEVILVDRFKNLDLTLDRDSIAIFVNPSTPDGEYYSLKKLFKMWSEQNITVIVDESFLEFCGKKSALKYLKNYKKLYILKSLTKFYSCAGVRVGVVISSIENIEYLKSREPLWRVSALDSAYILEILKNRRFKNQSIKKNSKVKLYLKKILKDSMFIEKIFKSDANFFLVKLSKIDAKELSSELAKFKIMIRDCSNFDFLDSSYVRVAIKSKKSLKIFKKALRCLES